MKESQKTAKRILRWFISRKDTGGTTYECEVTLGLPHQTCSPRVNELAKAGCLALTGERRKTKTSRASVYAAVPGASMEMYLGFAKRAEKAVDRGPEQESLRAVRAYKNAMKRAHSSPNQREFVMNAIRRFIRTIDSIQE